MDFSAWILPWTLHGYFNPGQKVFWILTMILEDARFRVPFGGVKNALKTSILKILYHEF